MGEVARRHTLPLPVTGSWWTSPSSRVCKLSLRMGWGPETLRSSHSVHFHHCWESHPENSPTMSSTKSWRTKTSQVWKSLFLLKPHTCWRVSLNLQFSSVAQLCRTLCDPMDCSTPGLPVHHQLPEFTQTHVHRVGDAIQPSHPLLSHSPPTFNLSQHQGLFKMSQVFES